MKKEQKIKLAKILSELDYKFIEKKDEIAKVGSYTVVFVPFSDASQCCGKCFLSDYRQGKKCLACRDFERDDKRNGYYRYSSQDTCDEVERRITSAKYRQKEKLKQKSL